MLVILLGLFQLIWLFGRGHHAVVLENLALRQPLGQGDTLEWGRISGSLTALP
jgi:hypothetical protein